MRRSEITRRLDRAEGDLRHLAVNSADLLDSLDRFNSGGYAPRGDTGPCCSSVARSPVEAAYMAPDDALTARQRYERLVTQLDNTLTDLIALQREWLARSRGGPTWPAPGCAVMAQVGVWELATLTDANGNLPGRTLLGRWAREFTIRHGRLPTPGEAERRAQGADIRVVA